VGHLAASCCPQLLPTHACALSLAPLHVSVLCWPQVPVLVDGELAITESPVVAEYVLRKYGSATGGWGGSGSVTGAFLCSQRAGG